MWAAGYIKISYNPYPTEAYSLDFINVSNTLEETDHKHVIRYYSPRVFNLVANKKNT